MSWLRNIIIFIFSDIISGKIADAFISNADTAFANNPYWAFLRFILTVILFIGSIKGLSKFLDV